MNEVAKYLTSLIKRHISHYGIVIWYDPQQVYRDVLNQLSLENIPVLKYEASFLQLRYELEPYLSRNEKPQLLIYVPLGRPQTDFALIEAESSGCYLAPGHPEADKNTSLENLAYQVLKDIIPASINHFVKKVQAGEYGLQDIENTARKGYAKSAGTLPLVFDRSDPVEILYHFLTDRQKDEALQQKNALGELTNLIQNQLGIAFLETRNYQVLREMLWRTILINDFLISTHQKQNIHSTLSQIPAIKEKPAQEVCLQLVQLLRERTPARSHYIEWSDQVENEFRLAEIDPDMDALRNCQTFRYIEERLFQKALQQFLEKRTANLLLLVEQRLKTFWGSQPPFNVQWQWLKQAVQFKKETSAILSTLNKKKWNVSQLVNTYSRMPDGWFRVDQLFHDLQAGYVSLEAEQSQWHDALERVWVQIRQLYSNFLREAATLLQEVYFQKQKEEKGWISQRGIFRTFMAPAVKRSAKVAYILVDALRFEMAVRIYEGLQGKHPIELVPALGQLPALTPVGMAALLPGAEKYMALSISGKKNLGITLGEKLLITRKDRVNYLRETLSSMPFFETQLHRIIQPGKSIREKIQQAQFILVTSQEIDQMGETLDSWMAHRIMDSILNDLQRGILQLLSLGVEEVIVTSDHGYLFGEELDPGEKIDAPGGQTLALHRRVWIGKGGIKHPGYIRLTEAQVGLSGDLELVFPGGIAAFKAAGGNEVYFHGGISLQELVIPVLVVKAAREAKRTTAEMWITLKMDKKQVTNRFFTVQLRYDKGELFASQKVTVRLLIQSGKEVVGRVVTADKGFDESTGQVELTAGEKQIATILLEKEPPPETVDILAIDTTTGALLAKLQNIPVKFLI